MLNPKAKGKLDNKNAKSVMNILNEVYLSEKSIVMVSHDKRFINYFDTVIKL